MFLNLKLFSIENSKLAVSGFTGLGESGDLGRECRVSIDRDRLLRATHRAVAHLLAQRNAAGHWVGELSTSALSTATAVMALSQFSQRAAGVSLPSSPTSRQAHACRSLIERGIGWLLANQNPDGGWGDTSQSFSNISTTMLCHATLVATRDFGADANFTTLAQNQLVTREEAIARAATSIDQAGGIPALIARYGKDKTFSVPILTHCALAGLVPWAKVPRLPFELACIPASWYAAAKFPVVSYALPALIAIGQVRHFHGPTWNPITRALRWLARDRSLQVLEKIQPPNGGFLEAAPLTSFVCMSLASMGLIDHPVVQRGIDFLIKSVRPDGSWPIDTNLATWVTTLAVNALGEDLPDEARPPILKWLLDQQYQVTHPYTNAAPGGWAWTDLPGGVPDADDTPGAILAVARLGEPQRASDVSRGSTWSAERRESTASSGPLTPALSPTVESLPMSEPIVGERGQSSEPVCEGDSVPSSQLGGSLALQECLDRMDNAIRWLINLQNRDGGFPTFCRGWGTLPFDRSSPDITAHCLRAIHAWLQPPKPEEDPDLMWACGLDDLQHQALEAIWQGDRSCRRSNGQMEPGSRSGSATSMSGTRRTRCTGHPESCGHSLIRRRPIRGLGPSLPSAEWTGSTRFRTRTAAGAGMSGLRRPWRRRRSHWTPCSTRRRPSPPAPAPLPRGEGSQRAHPSTLNAQPSTIPSLAASSGSSPGSRTAPGPPPPRSGSTLPSCGITRRCTRWSGPWPPCEKLLNVPRWSPAFRLLRCSLKAGLQHPTPAQRAPTNRV